MEPTISADATAAQTGSVADLGLPSKPVTVLALGRGSPETQISQSSGSPQFSASDLALLHPSACLVEQFSKGYASKGCPIPGKGHSVSVSPQASSMLKKQLQEEAHELRHLYQEKVLPQQNLVVSLRPGGRGGRSGG